jgi:RNA polymerase sigma-70 factor (ECF subfamily)
MPDRELSRLLQKSDEAAFRTLYERHWKRLYDMARSRLGEASEAEEVVQDIFCKLWRRRAAFVLDTSFDQYFSIAVKFEVINRLAKRARVITWQNELSSFPPPAAESLLQQMDYRRLQQQLRVTINALPQQSRVVFQLKHEGGYTLRQISRHLGISVKTVEAHLTKARKTIRVVLGSLLGSLLLLFCWAACG